MNAPRKPTFPCPHCHEPVPEGARACWSCGSDADTGWSSDEVQTAAAWDNPAEAMEDEEYADFLSREGLGAEGGLSSRRFGRSLGVGVVVIILVVLLLSFSLF